MKTDFYKIHKLRDILLDKYMDKYKRTESVRQIKSIDESDTLELFESL